MAKVMYPGLLVCVTGSSLIVFERHSELTAGSPFRPNWTMKVGITRKKRVSS